MPGEQPITADDVTVLVFADGAGAQKVANSLGDGGYRRATS
jgi:hypothetical protein